MTIGYLADTFDLINVRDLDLIAQARRACTTLVVGVFTDDYAEQLHGRRPVVPLAERLAILSHVRDIDEVAIHDGNQSLVGAEVVHFLVANERFDFPSDADVLIPQRETASPVLRKALSALTLDSSTADGVSAVA